MTAQEHRELLSDESPEAAHREASAGRQRAVRGFIPPGGHIQQEAVRKYRTMTEVIVDATEFVRNPYKGKKLKTHPEFPKKPLTPYFRFFMEKRAKYAKIHPEMSNLDLTKILSKKYKELPEKKKLKYITEFQREKEDSRRTWRAS
ncbi:hypothetical protein NQZ68_038708, partial [Dissostichus eleginoides]